MGMLLEITQDKIPTVWHKHFYFNSGSLQKWVKSFRESCEWIEKYDKEYYINLARIYNPKSLFTEYILQRTKEMKEDREREQKKEREKSEKVEKKKQDQENEKEQKHHKEEETKKEYISI